MRVYANEFLRTSLIVSPVNTTLPWSATVGPAGESGCSRGWEEEPRTGIQGARAPRYRGDRSDSLVGRRGRPKAVRVCVEATACRRGARWAPRL